jgi:peptidoglycan/LPS O-acetylase OafA/YrhL
MNNATNRIKTLDGLRGLSIILVFLNHLGFGLFEGGYVGVDVFFVISGFVITRSIRNHYGDPDFLSAFYERRIRRLLPSLITTILVCYGISQLFFDASDRLTINSSILPSALGFSNLFFYKQAGYFDETSIEKPLLHTWSLSVEEQFYIAYALLIFLLHKPVFKSHTKPAAALRLILLLSATASLLLSACVTNKHGSFSYFLIPTRFWEIGLGCLAFWYDWRLPARCSRIMPVLGLCLIFTGSVFFNSETPYPGIAAILPTAGTLFLILGQSNEGSTINRILSGRCLTFMGDISYALYLVHWPVIVFATAFFPGGLSLFAKFAIVCLSVFAASMLTFRIENPIRQKRFFGSRKSLFSFAASGVGMVALLSFFTMHSTPKPVHKMSLIVEDSVLKSILPNSGGGGLIMEALNHRSLRRLAQARMLTPLSGETAMR